MKEVLYTSLLRVGEGGLVVKGAFNTSLLLGEDGYRLLHVGEGGFYTLVKEAFHGDSYTVLMMKQPPA